MDAGGRAVDAGAAVDSGIGAVDAPPPPQLATTSGVTTAMSPERTIRHVLLMSAPHG
jgi:hypothetical protein